MTCFYYSYYGKIQDKDDEYYSQFQLVICGLDSIEARRWINAKLVDMVDDDDPTSLKPLIDGGTEGLYGDGSSWNTKLIDTIHNRLQGSGSCDIADNQLMLRMFIGYVQQTYYIPNLYNCQYTSSSWALHWMGFSTRMAKGLGK